MQNNYSYLKDIEKEIDSLSSQYENIILLGDFNCECKEGTLSIFCEVHNLKNLINEPVCFKNPEKPIIVDLILANKPKYFPNPAKPTIVDLILTNKPKYFQRSSTYKTGISDFHKMTVTVRKVIFKKQKPNIFFYRNYKNFDKKSFKEYLKLSIEAHDPSEFALKDFQNLWLTSLKSLAPLKKKYLRANQASFMNKKRKKAIMVRSKLRNKF